MIFWTPDPDYLVDYVIAGEEEGVKTLIDNEVPQLSTHWVNARTLTEVLRLEKPSVNEIMEWLKKAYAKKMVSGTETSEDKSEKSIEAKLGIKIINFNLNVKLVDEDVKAAMKQPIIEAQQKESEMMEINTEIAQAYSLLEEAKKRQEPMTFERAYKIVKIIKTNREQGVAPILGLDEAFSKGTASIADAAVMAFTGLMRKPAEAEPVKTAKGQQKKLSSGPKKTKEEPKISEGEKGGISETKKIPRRR